MRKIVIEMADEDITNEECVVLMRGCMKRIKHFKEINMTGMVEGPGDDEDGKEKDEEEEKPHG